MQHLISTYEMLIMGLSSVGKALTILMTFTPHNQESGSIELSRKLGFHNSTVNRLLHELASHDLLQQDPDTKKYSLGRSAAAIGRAINQSPSSRIVNIAQPYLNKLRDLVRESVSLEMVNGFHVILASEALGPPPLSVSFSFRERVPVYAAAGAKSIMAFLIPEDLDRFMDVEFIRFTPNTITDLDAFKRELAEVKRKGVAFDRGEYSVDVHAIGVPIFDHNRKPAAAITLCAPASRVKSHMESDVVIQLKEAAAEISARLLYSEEK